LIASAVGGSGGDFAVWMSGLGDRRSEVARGGDAGSQVTDMVGGGGTGGELADGGRKRGRPVRDGDGERRGGLSLDRVAEPGQGVGAEDGGVAVDGQIAQWAAEAPVMIAPPALLWAAGEPVM